MSSTSVGRHRVDPQGSEVIPGVIPASAPARIRKQEELSAKDENCCRLCSTCRSCGSTAVVLQYSAGDCDEHEHGTMTLTLINPHTQRRTGLLTHLPYTQQVLGSTPRGTTYLVVTRDGTTNHVGLVRRLERSMLRNTQLLLQLPVISCKSVTT